MVTTILTNSGRRTVDIEVRACITRDACNPRVEKWYGMDVDDRYITEAEVVHFIREVFNELRTEKSTDTAATSI